MPFLSFVVQLMLEPKSFWSTTAVRTMHPKKAQRYLREQTIKAIENRRNVKPLVPSEEPLLKVESTNYGKVELAAMMPGCELEEGTTIVRFQAKDILEACRAMLVMTELAMKAKFC